MSSHGGMGNIITFLGIEPDIHAEAFIAPGAYVIGKVEIVAKSSIWYNCTVRGDEEPIHIGAGTNIQDGTTIHTSGGIADTWIAATMFWSDICPCCMAAGSGSGHLSAWARWCWTAP